MNEDSATQSQEPTEKTFNFLYEDAPNPYQSLDINGNILKVNQKWLSLLGYKKQEVIGRWFGDMITADSRIFFNKNFTKFKANGSTEGAEFDMLHKNGTIVPIVLYGQITYDNRHTVLETHCSFKDISDKRKLQHLNGVLSVIREVNQLIVREKDTKKMLQKSCNILASKHIYGYAWIALYNDKHQVKSLTMSNKSKQFKLFKEKVKTGWKPYCIPKTDKIFNTIEDTKQTCSECPLKDVYKDQQAAFNIALKHKDKSYGYLNISIDKKYLTDKDEIALLKEVAGDIAYALYNIRREELLAKQEERYRFVVEGTTDGLWDWNLVTNDIYFSPRYKEILGYKDDELENTLKTWESLLHPEDKEQILSSMQLSREGHNKLYHNTLRLRHKDGHWLWIGTRGQTIFDKDGKALRMIGSHTDVTEQYKLRDLLQRAQSLSHLGSWEQNINDEQLFWSEETYRIFEIDPQSDISYVDFFNRVHPDDRSLIALTLKKSIDEHIEYYLEHRLLFPDGRMKYVIDRGEHFYDSNNQYIRTAGSVQDVTDKQNIVQQLNQKKKELEDIIQNAPNPIILHNEDGKILMINQAWVDASGYSYEETSTINAWVENTYTDEAVQLSLKKHIDSHYDITKKVDDGDFTFLNKNREYITWQFSSAPFAVIDGKHTIITSAMDITELKRKDEMLINQSRHAAMGEMIGMIAHQWRQPLTTISMDANNILLNVAIDDLNPLEAEKYATNINKQAQYLSQTIDDFRNFFKPDKESSQVNIRDILDQTLSIVKDSLKNNNIEFTSTFETETEVAAYPRELMQVFVNIITNAKDALVYTKREDALIRVRVYEDEKYVNTEICDNGGGIDTKILSKVFEPYFSTKDEKTGTGLGLYMSKMIIEEHLKGLIEVKNKKDGACFSVRLLKEILN